MLVLCIIRIIIYVIESSAQLSLFSHLKIQVINVEPQKVKADLFHARKGVYHAAAG
jgi:hypothetical protein